MRLIILSLLLALSSSSAFALGFTSCEGVDENGNEVGLVLSTGGMLGVYQGNQDLYSGADFDLNLFTLPGTKRFTSSLDGSTLEISGPLFSLEGLTITLDLNPNRAAGFGAPRKIELHDARCDH